MTIVFMNRRYRSSAESQTHNFTHARLRKYVNTHKCLKTQRTYGVYALENVRLLSASIVVSAFLIAIAVYQLALAGYQIAEAGRYHAVVLHDDDEFPRVLVLDSISQEARSCFILLIKDKGMRSFDHEDPFSDSHLAEVLKPKIIKVKPKPPDLSP
jgi:hypothetical protein